MGSLKMNLTLCSSCIIFFFFMFIATGLSTNSQPMIDDPIIGALCALVNCGEGKCVPSSGGTSLLPFDCECNSGWKKVQIGPLTYPACIIPNCTIDFGCGSSTPPSPPAPLLPLPSFNLSDPCGFTWCGEGTCVVDGSDHICQCNQGADNLSGLKGFPCFEECSLGADCNGVGLGVQPPPPPSTGSRQVPNSSWMQQSLSMLLLAAIFISML
ncbi:hypothetical protein AQUCO_00100639v1 [Aquilegia coerulea]|uniref:EGF-like domain-containing protein n=1 Tax=Aquilegia coerulea TaxID=218851 RepID=A0A2G5FBB5_AQUCA|nr:hypothetical protein AQUCO_00100639v1 [Aquilegia coerulea]